MPVPDSILALVPHRARYQVFYEEGMAAGMTCAESRLYAGSMVTDLVREGKLGGRPTPDFHSTIVSVIPSEDRSSVFYRSSPYSSGMSDDKSDDDRHEAVLTLPSNPGHAPQKIDRRLRLKPRVELPPPKHPFIKDRRPK